MIISRRVSVFIVFLFASIGQTLGYDSLGLALNFHSSSQYQKALPIFINLAQKFKVNNDISNYALCQLKIADIIRNYGGINLSIDMFTANEQFLEIRIERPSLELAQNFIGKAEAYYSANRLSDFKESILKSIKVKKQIGLPGKYLAEDYLHLARYYKEFRNQGDSCLFWIKQSLRLAKHDMLFSAYVLPRIYNLYGYYYHPPSIANYVGKVDLFYTHLTLSRKYYDSALLSIDRQKIKDNLMLGRVYHNLGNSFNNEYSENLKSETINMALSFYRKSLDKYEPIGSPTELVVKDWVIGKAYERLKLTDSAIAQFQMGIERLMPGFEPKKMQELPAFQPTINDSWFISLLSAKANNFYLKYTTSHKEEDLFTAYHHYVYLLKFHRYLLSQSLNENESINWNYLFGSNTYQLLLNNTDLNFAQTGIAQDRLYLKSNGNVGIGTRQPDSKLSVTGLIESTLGGFKFPDGTIQSTASSQLNSAVDGSSVSLNKSLSIYADPGTTYTRVLWRRLQNNATDSLLYHFIPDQWYYFAVSKKSTGEAIIYINGREMFKGNHANEAFNHTTFNIAASFFTSYGNFFNGTIDGIRISNVSKSTSEINQYWSSNTDFGLEANTFALWKFDEGTGATITSLSGSYTGNLVGTPQWVTGKFGNALSFDGVNDYGFVNLNLPTSNVTYETWVKFNSTSNSFSTILQPYGMFNLGLDLALSSAKNNEGLVLQSPNGNCWKITIDNSGNLVKAPISCTN